MLKVIDRFYNLDINQLFDVYAEQISVKCFNDLHRAQQSIIDDWLLFFRDKGNCCCVWAPDSRYVTVLRLEPYVDGMLITCLETAPQHRSRGYAEALLVSVKEHLRKCCCHKIYAHIHKANNASLSVHKKAGFAVISDFAHLVDGTVSCRYYTLIAEF